MPRSGNGDENLGSGQSMLAGKANHQLKMVAHSK